MQAGVPDAQLVLAGSMATDDPEGFHYWELADEARAGDPDIHLLSNIQQVGAVQINAFQRAADVVMQKSLREGFGLTVSEGLWKGRPVDRRPLRRHHDADRGRRERLPRRRRRDRGAAHRRAAARTRRGPTRWARRAASTCARTSCRPASSRTGCASSATCGDGTAGDRRLAPGPVPVRAATTTGASSRTAARAASSARSRRCSPSKTDATWIAAAMSRRRPRRGAGRARPTISTSTCGCSTSIPTLHRMHYDVVSNGVLWFLFHGLFDRVAPAALRPALPRRVGRVRRGERRVRRRDRASRGRRTMSCS